MFLPAFFVLFGFIHFHPIDENLKTNKQKKGAFQSAVCIHLGFCGFHLCHLQDGTYGSQINCPLESLAQSKNSRSLPSVHGG